MGIFLKEINLKGKTALITGATKGLGRGAAIALAQAGADVTIYEQAPMLMEIGAGINIQAVGIGVIKPASGLQTGRLGLSDLCLLEI